MMKQLRWRWRRQQQQQQQQSQPSNQLPRLKWQLNGLCIWGSCCRRLRGLSQLRFIVDVHLVLSRKTCCSYPAYIIIFYGAQRQKISTKVRPIIESKGSFNKLVFSCDVRQYNGGRWIRSWIGTELPALKYFARIVFHIVKQRLRIVSFASKKVQTLTASKINTLTYVGEIPFTTLRMSM